MKNTMRSQSVRVLLRFWILLSGLLVAAGVSGLELQKVDFSMAQGDQTNIVLTFDDVPPLPSGYAIAQPARIALDLVGVQSGLASKYHDLGSGTAQNVTILESGDRTRIIVALAELVGYTTRVSGRTLVISVGRDLGVNKTAEFLVLSAAWMEPKPLPGLIFGGVMTVLVGLLCL